MPTTDPYKPATVATVHHHLRRFHEAYTAMLDEVKQAANDAAEGHQANRPPGGNRAESEDGGK